MAPPAVLRPRKGALTATGAAPGLAFLVPRRAVVAADEGSPEIEARAVRLGGSAGGAFEVTEAAGMTILFPGRTD